MLADAPADLVTVHTGHHHVENDQIEFLRLEQTYGLLAAVGFADCETRVAQRLAGQHADHRVVVYEQHPAAPLVVVH